MQVLKTKKVEYDKLDRENQDSNQLKAEFYEQYLIKCPQIALHLLFFSLLSLGNKFLQASSNYTQTYVVCHFKA